MTFLARILAALVVSSGFLAVDAAAQAAPYHTVPTTCAATATQSPITVRQSPAFRYSLRANGNSRVAARVTIGVRDARTGRYLRTYYRLYSRAGTFVLPRMAPGSYRYAFHADTGARSVYKDCSSVAWVRIRR